MDPLFIEKRNIFYKNLSGHGLEIGAFEHPAKLPSTCLVTYCDVITNEQAKLLFPEVCHTNMKMVEVIVDLDQEGLVEFEDNSQNFVIINHVLEHLFDPVSAIKECFRVLKKNGYLILSVPDKRYTFDETRPLTKNQEIFKRINRFPKQTTPDDYIDILDYIDPKYILENLRSKFIENSGRSRNELLNYFLKRREHLNIWTDSTFLNFIEEVFIQLNVKAKSVYEVNSCENKFEFFGVWKKLNNSAS